jgi:hypothetical protein
MSLDEAKSIQRGKSQLATHGQKAVTTAGTEVQLTNVKTKDILIKALSTNTGLIFVGLNGVDSSSGYILSKNEEVLLPLDASEIYIDCSVDGEGVSFLGWH